nr:MAG TPA: hypothetical protein [Caudoviricetes sp.]
MSLLFLLSFVPLVSLVLYGVHRLHDGHEQG